MANMSYCRFYNTLIDMRDCVEALEDRDISSSEEKSKAKTLLKLVLEFCEDEGIIEGFDTDTIEEILEECE